MSDLHPEARALIDAARRREPLLSGESRARVHRSVLRRAAAFGAALASTSTATVAAKGGALAAAIGSRLVTSGVTSAVTSGIVSVVGGVALLVAGAVWMAPAPPPRAPPVDVPGAVHATGGAPRGSRAAPRPVPAPAVPTADHVVPTPEPVDEPARSGSRPPAERPHDSRVATRPGRLFAAVERPADRSSAAQRIANDGPGLAATGVATGAQTALPPAPRAAADLGAALDLLHRVRSALHAGQAAGALALLQDGAPILEKGPFAEEAQAARISALCRLRRESEARAAMDQFFATWPRSPLASRLGDGCRSLGGIDPGP